MITLFGTARSCASRSLLALEEFGLQYEHVPLPPRRGTGDRENLSRSNPNGHIPVLGAAVISILASATAMAARPLVTDDSRIVDPGACQLEAYVMRGHDNTAYWALPACNPFGNAELTLGTALVDNRDGTSDRILLAQVKTVLKSLDPNSWGVALAGGVTATPAPRSERALDSYYFYVPVTFSWRDDTSFLHINAGLNHVRNPSYTAALWGVANETHFQRTRGNRGGNVWQRSAQAVLPARWAHLDHPATMASRFDLWHAVWRRHQGRMGEHRNPAAVGAVPLTFCPRGAVVA